MTSKVQWKDPLFALEGHPNLHELDEVRAGFTHRCDVVVVGSGPGGFVAAANLAASGMKVALVEVGPWVRPEDMMGEAPRFLAKYYWEGGLRLVRGNSPNPAMMGRCLGGGSLMNSAIMLELPEWVRKEWAEGSGLHEILERDRLASAFSRIFKKSHTSATPMAILGKRNLAVKEALEAAGMPGMPLPRSIDGCLGCGNCGTGCFEGKKQSMDRIYMREFLENGGHVFTCSSVERVLVKGGKVEGVKGQVIDIDGWQKRGSFEIRAPRVIMAAGVAHTPLILAASGLKGRNGVGDSLEVHVTNGGAAIMDERIDPWHGATQGWGAFSPTIRGLKYESLWADTSLITVNFGGLGQEFLSNLQNIKHVAVFAVVYKGRVRGRVRRSLSGQPALSIHIPKEDVHTLMRGLKSVVDGFLETGARSIQTLVHPVPSAIKTRRDSEQLLSKKIRPQDCHMTFNHMFSSCPMHGKKGRGPVDEWGALRGVKGLWLTDSSIFPSASAVNPQATIMALSDIISRRIGEQSY